MRSAHRVAISRILPLASALRYGGPAADQRLGLGRLDVPNEVAFVNGSSVTVLVPARNASSTIRAQLDALSSQEYDGWWELLVVDNQSTDETSDIARSYADRIPNLRIIGAHRAPGVAVARNEGLRAAKGDVILCCDADDEVSPGWIQAMADALAHFDIVQGRLNEEKLNDLRRLRTRNDRAELWRVAGFLYTARGANMGVRRDVALSLDGWDESYSGGGEDVDFAWRVQLAGGSIGLAEEACIEYRLRAGVKPLWIQFYRYGKNRPVLYRKFASHGMRRPGWPIVAKAYLWCAIHIPDLALGPARRDRWIRRTAAAFGRFVGSSRIGVRYL